MSSVTNASDFVLPRSVPWKDFSQKLASKGIVASLDHPCFQSGSGKVKGSWFLLSLDKRRAGASLTLERYCQIFIDIISEFMGYKPLCRYSDKFGYTVTVVWNKKDLEAKLQALRVDPQVFNLKNLVNAPKYFTVGDNYLKIFGLEGFCSEGSWELGACYGGNFNSPQYKTMSLKPIPVSPRLYLYLALHLTNKNRKKVERVLIDNRTAVKLFLEGLLRPEDFEGAVEEEFPTGTFIDEGEPQPVVTLKRVIFKRHSYKVSIISELLIDVPFFGALNSDGFLM